MRAGGADPSFSLIRNAGAAVGQEFHELGAAHNNSSWNEAIFVQFAPLEAGRANVHLPPSPGEVFHEFFKRRKAFFTDVVCISFLAETHALNAEEHHGFLVGA